MKLAALIFSLILTANLFSQTFTCNHVKYDLFRGISSDVREVNPVTITITKSAITIHDETGLISHHTIIEKVNDSGKYKHDEQITRFVLKDKDDYVVYANLRVNRKTLDAGHYYDFILQNVGGEALIESQMRYSNY